MKLSGHSPPKVGQYEKTLGDTLEWRLWVGKQSREPLALSRSPTDLLFGMTNLSGTSSRMIGRSRTLPSIGTGSPKFPMAQSLLKSDPYQE